MQQYENCKIIEIDHHPNDLNNIGKDPQTGFWIRLQFESIISILFRLVSILSKKIYKFWPFKIIYYSHENSLLKRIAFKSFIKGYLLLKFPKYSFKVLNEENSFNIFTLEIYKNTKKTLTLYQKTILDTAYTKETEGFFNLKFKNYINEYVTALRFWEKEFAKGTQKKITTGLFGFPSTAMELAFCSLAKKNNIITASFQHAISKEISKDILSIDSIYESNIVDFYFVYNKYTALNSKFSRFHKSKDIVIGLPEDLRRGMNFKVSKTFNKFPILYASTNLYCGNRGISNRAGASEVDKANFELDLIKNILAKIPHKVEYKPYFAKRYTGESIEINEARSKKNIFINENEIDLRYITKKTRLIITSRATSTIAWCIFSSKPVIYIENFDNRLNDEARKIFKKCLFFYDVLDKKWNSNLFDFLNQDISIIESDWIDKQKSTGNLIFKFLGYDIKQKDKMALNKLKI